MNLRMNERTQGCFVLFDLRKNDAILCLYSGQRQGLEPILLKAASLGDLKRKKW